MNHLTAKDIMNPKVMSVREDMTLHELATFLTENQISGAPVLNEDGKLVGVVSVTDIAASEAERATVEADASSQAFDSAGWKSKLNREDLSGLHLEEAGLKVREIMTPAAYTVPETTSIPEMAKAMIAGRLHRLLVTRNRHLVGIITSLDMLKLLIREEEAQISKSGS